MSIVKLTAFSIFSVSDKNSSPVVECGATCAFVQSDGRTILTMDSVPMYWKLKPPGGGLLLMYGFRDTVDEIKKRRAEARVSGSDFHIAEVSVEVGEIAAPLVNEQTIKDLKFVNVKRMTASLQSIILTEFDKYADLSDGDESMAKIQQIATRPDLFEILLNECPIFQHIDLIVVPVAEDPQRPQFIRQLGYVRNGAMITAIDQNTERNEFILPDGMKVSG